MLEKGFRFFFFSREESRIHIHVECSDGEAKYWLDPEIVLAKSYNLSQSQLRDIESIIEVHHAEFRSAWEKHRNG